MDNSTLKPNFYSDFQSLDVFKEAEAAKDTLPPEEKELVEMSKTKGWSLIKTYIKDIQLEMDQMVTQAMQQGATYEEIGQRTIVKDLTKFALERVLAKVQEANDVHERLQQQS